MRRKVLAEEKGTGKIKEGTSAFSSTKILAEHKVKEGDIVKVELVEANKNKVSFDKVLAVSDGSKLTVGRPYLKGAKIAAELIENEKSDKVTILKYRRRKSSQSKRGHRQVLAKVKIESISEA